MKWHTCESTLQNTLSHLFDLAFILEKEKKQCIQSNILQRSFNWRIIVRLAMNDVEGWEWRAPYL